MPLHLALPIQAINGSYQFNEQDTQPEAMTQVKAIVSFPRGSRQESMEFGIVDPTFQVIPVDLYDIGKAISDYAPDLDVEISSRPDPIDGSEQINIKVSLPLADDIDEEL
jgi:hypothetical protein